MGDLAEALGVQKGSLYAHIDSKADLLWEVAGGGAEAFHAALDAVPEEGPVVERIRAALRGHLGVIAGQLDVATMFIREDIRPVTVFYTNPDWESVTFREQLDELSGYMPNLRVVHVLKQPPPGWRGPSGRLDADVLARYLPRQYQTFEYFICASPAMMDAVAESLLELGVSDYRIHSERFGMV